jgi:hypothetical protein
MSTFSADKNAPRSMQMLNVMHEGRCVVTEVLADWPLS